MMKTNARQQGQIAPLPQNQSGFTIIESLVAILVVSLLLVGLGPVITLSAASRLQAKRVELATKAARSYIDAIKAGRVQAFEYSGSNIKLNIEIGEEEFSEDNFKTGGAYPPPSSGTLNCTSGEFCTSPATDLYCIDNDGGGCSSANDMVVQGFGYISQEVRNNEDDKTNAQKGYYGYRLGVRVYRADAFGKNLALQGIGTQSSFTGGSGLTQQQAPLVQMTTEIPVGESDFQNLCDAVGVDSCG